MIDKTFAFKPGNTNAPLGLQNYSNLLLNLGSEGTTPGISEKRQGSVAEGIDPVSHHSR